MKSWGPLKNYFQAQSFLSLLISPSTSSNPIPRAINSQCPSPPFPTMPNAAQPCRPDDRLNSATNINPIALNIIAIGISALRRCSLARPSDSLSLSSPPPAQSTDFQTRIRRSRHPYVTHALHRPCPARIVVSGPSAPGQSTCRKPASCPNQPKRPSHQPNP